MDARAFLASRTPPPPEPLARRMDGEALDGTTPVEGLAEAAFRALEETRAAPGRVRRSAYHLLAADALLTWACEAALESSDPEPLLAGLLQRASNGR